MVPYRQAPLPTYDPDRAAIARFVQSDEEVLWVGRRGPGGASLTKNLPLYIPSLVLVAVLWNAGKKAGAFWLFLLWLGAMLVKETQDRAYRARIVYAITTQRLLVVDTAAQEPEAAVRLAALPPPNLRLGHTIAFDVPKSPRLERLEAAEDVYALLRDAIDMAKAAQRS